VDSTDGSSAAGDNEVDKDYGNQTKQAASQLAQTAAAAAQKLGRGASATAQQLAAASSAAADTITQGSAAAAAAAASAAAETGSAAVQQLGSASQAAAGTLSVGLKAAGGGVVRGSGAAVRAAGSGGKWVAVQGVRAVELSGRVVGSLMMQMAGGAVMLSRIFSKMFQGERAQAFVSVRRLLFVISDGCCCQEALMCGAVKDLQQDVSRWVNSCV
jgi:hypothetical protein